MILGIDASNIRVGGGLAILIGLLSTDPRPFGFTKIIVWARGNKLETLPTREWIEYRHHYLLDKNILFRIAWQILNFSRFKKSECDILLVPGGSYYAGFKQYVPMMLNLLPFDWREIRRYGLSRRMLRFIFLRLAQIYSFKNALGVITLTEDTKKWIVKKLDLQDCVSISPGVNDQFKLLPKNQKNLSHYNMKNPFRILYVSVVDVYKHQWHVVEAVGMLRKEGLPISLDLVGASHKQALEKLNKSIIKLDPHNEYINYLEKKSHDELVNLYATSDLFVFASSCETFGIILLEAMAAGLPIACSNNPVLKETLGDAGVYFNPESPSDIAEKIKQLFHNELLRDKLARLAYEKSRLYSWEQFAEKTYSYLANVFSKGA